MAKRRTKTTDDKKSSGSPKSGSPKTGSSNKRRSPVESGAQNKVRALGADLRAQIAQWAEEAASVEGLELYDLELVLHRRWIIRVYIDHPGPISEREDAQEAARQSVSAGQCEQVSRYLEAYLDAAEGVPENYLLEVSSPGIERALKTPAHFQKAIGQQVQLVVRQQVAGKNKVVGELVDFQDQVIRLRLEPAEEPVDIQWADMKEARLKYDFDF